MQLSHTPATVSASFDDPNLVSTAGLIPVMRLADEAGLTALAQDRLSVPTDKGANAGAKIATLVSGMVAGADSIDDMDQLTPRRHEHTVRPDLRPVHVGIVPAVVHLRTRAPAGCHSLPILGGSGRAGTSPDRRQQQ